MAAEVEVEGLARADRWRETRTSPGAAPTQGDDSTTLPDAQDDGSGLPFGYSLDQVQRLAGTAARTVRLGPLGPDEAFEVAWGEVVESLYTATEGEPGPGRLVVRARLAVRAAAAKVARAAGVDRTTGRPGTSPRFAAYWMPTAAGPGLEDKVVDRLALAQVWAKLTEVDREALSALAAHGTHQAAAAALGLEVCTFGVRVRSARARFLRWWHEGEPPSTIWRVDRRAPGHQPARRKLTIEQVEAIRDRAAAGGVTQRALASEFGVSEAAVSLIISRRTWKRRPAPPVHRHRGVAAPRQGVTSCPS